MTIQENAKNLIDEEELFVIDYLERKSNFFYKNQRLLTHLRVPHHSGKAISLVERQLDLLRKKCNQYENHLNELLDVARDNEVLNQKLIDLACKISMANSLLQLESLLYEVLTSDFNTDKLAFYMTGKNLPSVPQESTDSLISLQLIIEGMQNKDIVCMDAKSSKKINLFNKQSEAIKSAALIGLGKEKELGVMILGSYTEDVFSADKGLLILERLRNLVSAKIKSLEI